jgi:hypothetical protein
MDYNYGSRHKDWSLSKENIPNSYGISVRIFHKLQRLGRSRMMKRYGGLKVGIHLIGDLVARLGNPFGIPRNSAIIPILDLLDSGIFFGILFFR